MNRKRVKSFIKRLTVSMLAVGMIITGIIAYPGLTDVEATDSIKDKVLYEYFGETETVKHWTESSKTAPVKEGYVFGGWFKLVNEEEKTHKAEQFIDEQGASSYYEPLTTVEGAAYAKFVPAQVLSVKTQNEAKVDKEYIETFTNEVDSFYVRVMTSLDSANYQKVGFDIYLGNRIKAYKEGTTNEPTETTKIYSGVMVSSEDGTTQVAKEAKDIFGDISKYVAVWPVTNINYKENVSLIIYVRPYWYTMDGTKVDGLAKYVHIEDEYLNYINVPVNLLGGEKFAAGAVNMTYTNTSDDTLTLVAFEKGRIFSEMNYNYTGKTVKMIGNHDEAGTYPDNNETIYANLRFAKPTVDTEFNITDDEETFCNWNEESVDVKKVWDTRYEYEEQVPSK